MRLSFAYYAEYELKEGAERLAAVINRQISDSQQSVAQAASRGLPNSAGGR